MESKVVGIVLDREAARKAVDALIEAGFPPESISVAARQYGDAEESGVQETKPSPGRLKEPPGMATASGAVEGGIIGGIGGLLLGLGGLVLPELGALVVAGPLALALGGAAVGAVGGGLVGALRDLGLTDEQVNGFMTSIEAGAVLIMVQTDEHRAQNAVQVLERAGVQDIHRIARRDRQVR